MNTGESVCRWSHMANLGTSQCQRLTLTIRPWSSMSSILLWRTQSWNICSKLQGWPQSCRKSNLRYLWQLIYPAYPPEHFSCGTVPRSVIPHSYFSYFKDCFWISNPWIIYCVGCFKMSSFLLSSVCVCVWREYMVQAYTTRGQPKRCGPCICRTQGN